MSTHPLNDMTVDLKSGLVIKTIADIEETKRLLNMCTPKQREVHVKDAREVLMGKRNHRPDCLHRGLVYIKVYPYTRVFRNPHKAMETLFTKVSPVYYVGVMAAGYTFDREHLEAAYQHLLSLCATQTETEVLETLTPDVDTVTTTQPVANLIEGVDLYLQVLSRKLQHGIEHYHYSGGRRFASGISMQGCPKEYRHTLLNGTNTDDVDMANAHPTFLLQRLRLHGVVTEGSLLQEYVDSREQVIAAHPDYDIKQAVRMLVYGAGLRTVAKTCGTNIPQWVKDLKAELNLTTQALLLSDIPYVGYGRNSRKLSVLLNGDEDRHLQAMEKWCASNDKSIRSLMFDGMMVQSLTDVELHEMETYANNVTGNDIKLVRKERY